MAASSGKICISNAPSTLDYHKIRRVFKKCGDILKVYIVRQDGTWNCSGQAYVVFGSGEGASKAVDQMDGAVFDEAIISVELVSEEDYNRNVKVFPKLHVDDRIPKTQEKKLKKKRIKSNDAEFQEAGSDNTLDLHWPATKWEPYERSHSDKGNLSSNAEPLGRESRSEKSQQGDPEGTPTVPQSRRHFKEDPGSGRSQRDPYDDPYPPDRRRESGDPLPSRARRPEPHRERPDRVDRFRDGSHADDRLRRDDRLAEGSHRKDPFRDPLRGSHDDRIHPHDVPLRRPAAHHRLREYEDSAYLGHSRRSLDDRWSRDYDYDRSAVGYRDRSPSRRPLDQVLHGTSRHRDYLEDYDEGLSARRDRRHDDDRRDPYDRDPHFRRASDRSIRRDVDPRDERAYREPVRAGYREASRVDSRYSLEGERAAERSYQKPRALGIDRPTYDYTLESPLRVERPTYDYGLEPTSDNQTTSAVSQSTRGHPQIRKDLRGHGLEDSRNPTHMVSYPTQHIGERSWRENEQPVSPADHQRYRRETVVGQSSAYYRPRD